MHDLIEIIKGIDKYKMRHIDIINNGDSEDRYTQVYEGIKIGKLKTEEEIAKFLSEDKQFKGSSNFSFFKKEFRKRFLNSIIFINPHSEDFDEYQTMFYETNKVWIAIRNINAQQLGQYTLGIAEEIFKMALEYEYTEMILNVTSHFKSIYALHKNTKKYDYYLKIQEEYTEILILENKARTFREKLLLEYVESAEFRPNISEIAKGFIQTLEPFLEKCTTITFQYSYRVIEIYIYSTIGDFENILKVAEKALHFFENKHFKRKIAISTFLEQKCIALTQLKRYDTALESIEAANSLRPKGTFNWFKGLETKMFLLFKTYDFNKTIEVYNLAHSNESLKTFKGLSREIWFLFEAYLNLTNALGKSNTLIQSKDKKHFVIVKFLNQMEVSSFDSKGMGLSILVIRICILLVQNNANEVLLSSATIKRFLSRNTQKNDPTLRFQIFIKLLLELPKKDIEKNVFDKNVKILLKELEETEAITNRVIFRTEIIPLELIWEWLLEFIENKK